MFGKLWKWLSGKKTAIGMGLVIIAKAGRSLYPEGEAFWHLAEQAGMAIGGGGLLHKAYKTVEDSK